MLYKKYEQPYVLKCLSLSRTPGHLIHTCVECVSKAKEYFFPISFLQYVPNEDIFIY